MGMVAESVLDPVDDRFVLASDVPAILREAERQWDYTQSH